MREASSEIANRVGRMLCPECNGLLWLEVKEPDERTRMIPAYTFDPYISQGMSGLLGGKCMNCDAEFSAHRIIQRRKRGNE